MVSSRLERGAQGTHCLLLWNKSPYTQRPQTTQVSSHGLGGGGLTWSHSQNQSAAWGASLPWTPGETPSPAFPASSPPHRPPIPGPPAHPPPSQPWGPPLLTLSLSHPLCGQSSEASPAEGPCGLEALNRVTSAKPPFARQVARTQAPGAGRGPSGSIAARTTQDMKASRTVALQPAPCVWPRAGLTGMPALNPRY